ncbi:hypothetical protein AGMMS49938_18210 [Fibrobacterales bacterium]|nr:hypothetical protein AGMMS49938_18210 [Fibrobacterales bacterium]
MKLKNVDAQTLLNRIKAKNLKLICFGAGKQLSDACDAFADFGFFDAISEIVDNVPKQFTWHGRIKEALPPEIVFANGNADNTIVYIASSFYPEIYEQLERYHELANVACYIHDYVAHMPLSYDFARCQHSDVPLIPKKIHYCWFGGKEIPKQNRIWMESWKKHCPDYEIITWDESNYDITKNKYMYAAYKEKKYAFVSDYARLDIVYQHGGIYLDNDVELFASLDRLLYNEAFCGIYSFYGPNLGLGFGAKPNSKIISELRDYYDRVSFYNEDGTLNQTDCLHHQDCVLKKYGYKNMNIPQVIEGLIVYPTDVLSPFDVWCNNLSHTKNTVAAHHFDASWLDMEEADLRRTKQRTYNDFWREHPII